MTRSSGNEDGYTLEHGDGEKCAHPGALGSSVTECIKVIVRVRPITPREAVDGSSVPLCEGKTRISVADRQYTFDRVFDQLSTQEQIFETVGKPIVDACLNGAHGSIFAYGQTGSGKTYTMVGNESLETRGVIPRVLEYLFNRIAEKENAREIFDCSIACSFLEIYKERVRDLLLEGTTPMPMDQASGKRNLQIRQDAKRVYVENLIETKVRSVAQAQLLLSQGSKRKQVSKTSMNDTSSRSHTVFTLVVTCSLLIEGSLQKQTSRLNLVDLAGSESQRSAATAGERLKEGCKINQSLSALGNVIMALARTAQMNKAGGTKRKAGELAKRSSAPFHIPYRDSKLTWLLKDSLGGSSKTYLIANVSPALSCVNETVSTLNFALRAKDVENKVVLHKGINEAELPLEVQSYIADLHSRYQQEIMSLQAQLEALQRSTSVTEHSCQCNLGVDVVEVMTTLHQMQQRAYEAHQELLQVRKQLASEVAQADSIPAYLSGSIGHSSSPSLAHSSPFSSCCIYSPSALPGLLPPTEAPQTNTPLTSHPILRPSTRGTHDPGQKSIKVSRVPTPIVPRISKDGPRSSSSSCIPLHGFCEDEQEDLQPASQTNLLEQLAIEQSPMLTHTLYQPRSGSSQSTHVSPFTLPFTPSHLRFDPASPSPTSAAHHELPFSFVSPGQPSPHPYQLRSADKARAAQLNPAGLSPPFALQPASHTPSRKPFTPLKTYELRQTPQRTESIQFNPTTHLEDCFKGEHEREPWPKRTARGNPTPDRKLVVDPLALLLKSAKPKGVLPRLAPKAKKKK